MNFETWCSKTWIVQDIPHQIWEAQTADGHVSPIIVRFFHNKFFFWINNYFRCYLTYWSVDTISSTISIFASLLSYYGLIKLIQRKWTKLLIILLIAPVLTLFEFPTRPISNLILLVDWVVCALFGLYFAIIDLAILYSRYFHREK